MTAGQLGADVPWRRAYRGPKRKQEAKDRFPRELIYARHRLRSPLRVQARDCGARRGLCAGRLLPGSAVGLDGGATAEPLPYRSSPHEIRTTGGRARTAATVLPLPPLAGELSFSSGAKLGGARVLLDVAVGRKGLMVNCSEFRWTLKFNDYRSSRDCWQC